MGQVRVRARLTGPVGSESVEFIADTGATFTILPRAIADRLGLVPLRDDPVRLAGGARVTYPRAEVRLEYDGQTITTSCWIVPGGDALLGVVALESLLLQVDPVGRRLVPTEGLAGLSAATETYELSPDGRASIASFPSLERAIEEAQAILMSRPDVHTVHILVTSGLGRKLVGLVDRTKGFQPAKPPGEEEGA